MRRLALASAAAVALSLAAPSQARADLTLGDLSQAIDDLLTGLFAMLLTPFEDLARMELPTPLPEPPVGDHVAIDPVTVDQSIDYAAQRVADRYHRIDLMDEITALAGAASTTNSASLAVLEAANTAPPISVASQIQLGNAAVIANSGAIQTLTQMVAAQTALQSDQAMQDEHSREISVEQYKIWSGYDEIAGGVQMVPDGALNLP